MPDWAGRCRSPAPSPSSAGGVRRPGASPDHRTDSPFGADQPAPCHRGLLFFLQSFATLLFGTDFRNIGVRLPIIELGGIYISYARLLAFAMALIGAVVLYFFLKRTFIGTRSVRSPRTATSSLDGVDQRRIYLLTSAIGGGLAGSRPASWHCSMMCIPSSAIRSDVIFMICVLGGLGDMIGGFIAAFIISQIISIGGYYSNTELSYVLAFTFFIVLMFVRPRGILAR